MTKLMSLILIVTFFVSLNGHAACQDLFSQTKALKADRVAWARYEISNLAPYLAAALASKCTNAQYKIPELLLVRLIKVGLATQDGSVTAEACAGLEKQGQDLDSALDAYIRQNAPTTLQSFKEVMLERPPY